jgi:hypothetical protein
VATSRAAAEEDVTGDPFCAKGLRRGWSIRAGATMLAADGV